jgi:hypothetical protein
VEVRHIAPLAASLIVAGAMLPHHSAAARQASRLKQYY